MAPCTARNIDSSVADASTHASLLDDEADSAAAGQAIRDVVVSIRTARPLPGR